MLSRKCSTRARSWIGLLSAGLLCCVGLAGAAPTPEHTLMGLRDALVRNDLTSVVNYLIPPGERERQRLSMAKQSERELSAESLSFKRRQFDEGFGMLIAPDSVGRIMAELGPKLEQMRLPMLAGQAMFFMEAGQELQKSEQLSTEQKQQLLALMHATQLYLARTDVWSSERARSAVSELVQAARATGIVSFEQMERLQYDEALQRFSVFLTAGKRMLGHYDLDANAVLRSARFRTLKQTPNSAEVELELTILDVPLRAPLTLYAHGDQGWYLTPDPERPLPPEVLDPEIAAALAEMDADMPPPPAPQAAAQPALPVD